MQFHAWSKCPFFLYSLWIKPTESVGRSTCGCGPGSRWLCHRHLLLKTDFKQSQICLREMFFYFDVEEDFSQFHKTVMKITLLLQWKRSCQQRENCRQNLGFMGVWKLCYYHQWDKDSSWWIQNDASFVVSLYHLFLWVCHSGHISKLGELRFSAHLLQWKKK